MDLLFLTLMISNYLTIYLILLVSIEQLGCSFMIQSYSRIFYAFLNCVGSSQKACLLNVPETLVFGMYPPLLVWPALIGGCLKPLAVGETSEAFLNGTFCLAALWLAVG